MENVKIAIGCLTIVFSLTTSAIWYYILYNVLVAIQPAQVIWILFWAYIPVALITGLLGQITISLTKK